jgi:hypothetical protein
VGVGHFRLSLAISLPPKILNISTSCKGHEFKRIFAFTCL